MQNERVSIKASDEEQHFHDEDMKQIEKLRAKAAKEADEAYSNDHKNHCFRCGTQSLVEVEHTNVKIDICVNEGCGAVHLDPGEMEKIIEGEKGVFGKITNSIFSVFK